MYLCVWVSVHVCVCAYVFRVVQKVESLSQNKEPYRKSFFFLMAAHTTSYKFRKN